MLSVLSLENRNNLKAGVDVRFSDMKNRAGYGKRFLEGNGVNVEEFASDVVTAGGSFDFSSDEGFVESVYDLQKMMGFPEEDSAKGCDGMLGPFTLKKFYEFKSRVGRRGLDEDFGDGLLGGAEDTPTVESDDIGRDVADDLLSVKYEPAPDFVELGGEKVKVNKDFDLEAPEDGFDVDENISTELLKKMMMGWVKQFKKELGERGFNFDKVADSGDVDTVKSCVKKMMNDLVEDNPSLGELYEPCNLYISYWEEYFNDNVENLDFDDINSKVVGLFMEMGEGFLSYLDPKASDDYNRAVVGMFMGYILQLLAVTRFDTRMIFYSPGKLRIELNRKLKDTLDH